MEHDLLLQMEHTVLASDPDAYRNNEVFLHVQFVLRALAQALLLYNNNDRPDHDPVDPASIYDIYLDALSDDTDHTRHPRQYSHPNPCQAI
ncbi:hypothetical protein D3C75_878150 [compost metagenome]